ncbi:MAG: signal peptide peptidase SppA [Flavobacterium sp.]|nr:signal peptide peptidase SppA [Flavobacterium sp.]
MKFLGNVLATLVGLFIFCMISFFGLLLLGAIFGGEDDTVQVYSDSVIELDLSKIENDYAGKINFTDFQYFDAQHNGLVDVLHAIEYATTDDKIKGISILNSNSSLGLAQTKALRDALEDFKKSGKFIYAYANYYSQKEYYLNSVADKIYLNPVGELELKGLSVETMFFKDFQEKSGIKVEVIRHGKFKSAVEPFLENKMSDANKEQTTALLNSLWSSVISDISKSRNISISHLNEIAENLSARTPQMAKNEKLIDEIAYEDVYHNDIKKALKSNQEEEYTSISIDDYAEKVATSQINFEAKDKIAIIYAQGEIMSGEGDVTVIGEGAMRRSLKEAREDENVKSIVLRIDSPGGDALTSELIWREIELTKKVKPVVVSMGNYAASGGYYIACNAHKIYAEATTITGSIGVFGMLPNFTTAANKIGISTETVKTHTNAAGFSPFTTLDSSTRAFAQEGVERIYFTFVNRVASGRKLTTQQVDAIGQGRVWTGQDAKKIGLVDAIGGLDDAIKEAAKLGKTTKYRLQDYPEFDKSFNDLLENFGLAQTKEKLLKEELGTENYMILQRIKQLSTQKRIQARMSFDMKIE